MKWRYKSRWLAEQIKKATSFSPIVVVSGARQTGKSTLLQHEFAPPQWQYITLDDLDMLAMAQRRPEELLAISDHLIIDEVQRNPDFLLSVKRAVDRDRNRRFILSGSTNLLLMKSVSESLAGRATYFELLPMAYREEKEAPIATWMMNLPEKKPPQLKEPHRGKIEELLFRGALPPVLFLSDDQEISSWWRGYVRTYLERDLRDLTRITNLPDFRKMMGLLAMRNGQILRQSEIARDAGLSQATAGRYINLLEITGLLVKLNPYSANISKRIIKSPKAYFIDPGLVCALTGVTHPEEITESMRGMLFESYICLNLLVFSSMHGGNLYYFRTQGGKEKEVDFILEMGKKIVTIEVKYAKKVGIRDAGSLFFLREMLPGWKAGLVVYNGSETLTLGKDIFAIPWSLL
ncbi:MAG: ATP-binding protein [Desulfobacterota bacterium]|nr:ATP-binding protein [Thermodesulfobacteriota bacterium]